MVMSRLLRSNAPGLSSNDANDLFMRSHCAQWGARVLSRYPRLDRETLEFVIWVLDPMSGTIERVLSNNDVDIDPDGPLADHTSSPSDQAAAIVRLLDRPGTASHETVVRDLITELERLIQTDCTCSMARSLVRVTETYGLSMDELSLAFFLASISAWTFAERLFDDHLECTRPTGRKYLLAALDMTHAGMKAVLHGKLPKIGILDLNSSWLSLDSDFTPLFTDPSEVSSLKGLHRALPKSDVPVQKLGIAESDLSIIKNLLTAKGKKPIHILLYGPPGTGKTSLARGLVQDLDLDGLEVMGRVDGSLNARRGAIEACWNMSSGMEDRILVIDEADHILGTANSWMTSGNTADKAWVNDVLERPGVRSIWIVNQTDAIEPAVRRRIDFSLELPVPDLRMRRTMLEGVLRLKRIKRHFSAKSIRSIAKDYIVSPAVMAIAAETAFLSQDSSSACRDTFLKALNSQLRLAREPIPARKSGHDVFLREGINTSIEFDTLKSKVLAYDKRWRDLKPGSPLPAMNLLFHGAPGTGKSYTAQHLADLIDRPALVKRASDLLDPYVGMSERNVAAAFIEARSGGAVLVIDEIDSFLYKREMAHRTWEASLVSEFLVQLEQGPGMVIGTTNRLNAIDMASKRRFIIRAEFRFLGKAQIVELYMRVFREMVSKRLSAGQINHLSSISNATAAGLFSVYDGLMLSGELPVCHDRIIDEVAMEFECLSREGLETVTHIGFN